MNYLDIASVVIIMWATWTGLQRGLIRSLSSLIGWLLALVLGSRFAPVLAPKFSVLTQDPVVQKIAAFAAIAALVLFVSAIIGNLLRRMLKALRLGLTEQAAGGVFGAAKGSLILMIAIQLLGPWMAESPYWQKSKMVSWLSPYAPMAVEMSEHVAGHVWDEVKSRDAREEPELSTEPVDQYEHNVGRRDAADTVPNPFS